MSDNKNVLIEVRGLCKSFDHVKVLNGISTTISQGEVVAIIGPSGCGKSTFLRSMNLLEKPTSGSILFEGTDITDSSVDINKMRQKIGMVFQQFNLFPNHTVKGNIMLAPVQTGLMTKEEASKRADELLVRVGLSDKADVYPAMLSGGQKQRIAIARALASDPKVLLCDEATSALDPATTQSILKLLKEINRTLGITILLITHEMEVVKRICDQVAVIDKGRLIEQGTVSEIFSNPKTELAQEFISSTFHITLPEEYLENLSDTPKHAKSYPIIKFEFTGRSVDAPLLSQASKKFGVELSILTSQIDYAGGVKFGFTIAEVEGDEDAITQAKVYLMENNVRVEVLGYVQ